MDEKLDLSNIECSILGMGDKDERRKIDQVLAMNFVINYLSYRSKSELKYIVDSINEMGLIHITAEKIIEPDYHLYDPDYIIPYIIETPLEEHKRIKPFILSEELRLQIQNPENRFSDIAEGFLKFTYFMHNLVRFSILLSDKVVESDSVNTEKLKTLVRGNIEHQLYNDETNYGTDEENNFLIAFSMLDCLERKEIFLFVFDLNAFKLNIFEIKFNDKGAFLFQNSEESNKNPISKKLLKKFDEAISKYKKSKHSKKHKQEIYTEFSDILRDMIKEHNKSVEKYITCAICGANSFHRSINLGTNTKYCAECWKLIDLIYEIKKLLKNVSDENAVEKASIIKSLRKDERGQNKYLDGILRNLNKSKVKNKNSIIAKYQKQIETLFNIEYI